MRRHLHSDGEAGVEVDEGDVVDAQPGLLERGGTGEADGGGAVQLGALGDEPVIVGTGAGEGEDPALVGHPGGAGGRHGAHHESCSLVDLHVGGAQLGVRERHHAVAGPRGDDLVGRPGGAEPCIRVAGRDPLKRDHSAPMRARCSCSVQPLAARSAFSNSG